MTLSATNVIVIYRDGDAASESFSDEYVALHSLDADQKQSIACSSAEILSDEATFNTQVLNPLKSVITTVEGGGRTVSGILLGYNVPGGYNDGDDIISST